MVCGFCVTSVNAAQKCGKLIQRDDGATDLEADGWTWHLYKDGKPATVNSSLGVCANNQCITVSSDNFNAACINYATVAMLSLYESVLGEYGCTAGYAYTASKCIENSQCASGYSACNGNKYHKSSCYNGCSTGFFYDTDASTCVACPSYYTKEASKAEQIKYGTTSGCATTSNALKTRCYLQDVTNGYNTATKDRYTISGGLCFYSN